MEKQERRLKELAPAVKNMERLAADFSADYKRVKKVFGPEKVKAAVQADKQWEQAEKGHKHPRHSLDREGRETANVQ